MFKINITIAVVSSAIINWPIYSFDVYISLTRYIIIEPTYCVTKYRKTT